MGWLGQGQVCQCFYFEHIDDLFKPSNLMTLTTLTTSKRLAEQTLSLLRLCTPVCFTHFTTPMQRVHVHILASVGTVDIYLRVPAFTVSSTCGLLFTLHCTVEKMTVPARPLCQSAANQAKKALEGTITECDCNSFSYFLAADIANE